MRLSRRRAIGLGVAAGAAVGAAGVVAGRLAVGAGAEGVLAGQWTPLGELVWTQASSGWLGVANQHRPRLDLSFAARPLSIGGQQFERGIGTYPVSEITYSLNGAFSRFSTQVGVDDASLPGPSGVRFLVFADDVLRYESPVRRAGDPPLPVDLTLNGAETLRLVAVDVREDESLLYVDWADPMLFRPVLGTPIADALWDRQVRADLSKRADGRAVDEKRLTDLAAAELASLELHLGPVDDARARVAFDPAMARLVLANRQVALAVGLDGDWRGKLMLFDRQARRLVLDRFAPAVALPGRDAPLRLDVGAAAGRHAVRSIDEPGLGRGQQVEVIYPRLDDVSALVLWLTVFDDRPFLLYRLGVRGPGAHPDARFTLLDGALAMGHGAQYVTDFSRLRHGRVYDDGIPRRESVGPGKPVFLWSEEGGHGLLAAALEEGRGPTELSVRRDPGTVAGPLRLELGPWRGSSVGEVVSPRLYLEVPPSVDLRASHTNLKRAVATLRPPAVLPSWVKYQWITWYAFNVEIDDAKIRRQIDYIADNLADLGPWHVLIDAGWYVAEGRPGADWRNVDRAKFPGGLRPLVDYAHSRGVRVMGYVSVPYLDDRRRPGDWLGLGDLIERHPGWLLKLGGDAEHRSYAFDFDNPGVRDYWRSVIHDLLIAYDMDAIKVDGLGNAEGAQLSPDAVDAFGRVDAVADQALDIYRFFHAEATALKPDVYLQAGWMTPTLANPYCHAFWYGDDYPAFSNPYPFPGLREKVDYATISHRLLGQRSNMGNVYDAPNGSQINRWWIGAGLALGTQVALSFDLTRLTAEGLAAYRGLLAHYDAFGGETRFGPGLYPDYFATTIDGTTYLGVMNRDREARTIVPSLADLGGDPAAEYAAYDVEADRFFRVRGEVALDVDGESFRLYVLRREPGVLWTTSAVTLSSGPSGPVLEVRGPVAVRGRLDVAAPEPQRVEIDGAPLPRRGPETNRGPGWWYDSEAGVLRLRYGHRRPHRLAIVPQT